MEAVSSSSVSATVYAPTASNDATSPTPTVKADASTSATPAVATVFSQNTEQFASLSSTVLDKSGKYSLDEKLKAYSSLFGMAVTGKLIGMDKDNRKILDQALMDSDIGKQAAQLQQQEVGVMIAAGPGGGPGAVAQAKFFASLSDDDQKINFNVTANPYEESGNRRYSNIDEYRDYIVENLSAGDPKGLGNSLKGMSSAKLGAAWNKQILSVLGSYNPSSSNGNNTGLSTKVTPSPKMPLSYNPGYIFSQVV